MTITLSKQWQSDTAGNGIWADIAGATNAVYTAGASDVGNRLRLKETAQSSAGQSISYSAPSPIIVSSSVAPANLPSVARVRDRIFMGGRLDEAEITTLGVQAAIERQLNSAALTYDQGRKFASWPNGFDLMDYPLIDDLGPQPLHVARMAGRKDALKAYMHEFWANHFVSGYQIRATIRLASLSSFDDACYFQGLGNFKFLLKKFIMSCSLQYFMDNYLNIAGNVNENLGREVLELFCFGVGEADEEPHFDTTLDVFALTRVLTGHGVKTLKTSEAGQRIDNDPRHVRGATTDYDNVLVKRPDGVFEHNQNSQTSWFYPTAHDGDPVSFTFWPGVVFSNQVDGRGVEGYDVHPSLQKFLDMASGHRPVARFMCDKIATWFLGVKPRVATRTAMMDKWVEAKDAPDQIAQVLRVLFYSEDFCTDFATGKRSLNPMAWYSKFLNYFGESFFAKRDIAIIKGYCEKEDYNTLTYQTPAGYPDEVDYWLSPGHLYIRALWGQTLLPTNKNNQADFCVDYTAFCQAQGFTTPRQLLNDVGHYWFADRATAAQMNFLGSDIFGSGLDSTIDWNTDASRGKVRELFRTLIQTDLAHFAA